MQVTITDAKTSARLFAKSDNGQIMQYLGCDLNDTYEYCWVGRSDKLTEQDIKKGLQQNPQAVVFTAQEFCEITGTPWEDEMEGYTVRLWPSTNGIHLFMHYSIPAYTQIPDGEEGELITVEIEED